MKTVVAAIAGLLLAVAAVAQEPAPSRVLFTSVNIFDGSSGNLARGQKVLVEGHLLKAIGERVTAASGATVIDGGGRTLMPGLMDAHVHLALAAFEKAIGRGGWPGRVVPPR